MIIRPYAARTSSSLASERGALRILVGVVLTLAGWLSGFSGASAQELFPGSLEGSCVTPPLPQFEFENLPYFGKEDVLTDLLAELGYPDRTGPVARTVEPGILFRIPVQFWIYRRDDGTGGPTLEDLQFWMDELNDIHRANGSRIRFYQKCGLGFVDDDDHLTVSGFEGFLQTAGLTGRKAKGAVNIHVVRDVKNAGAVYNSASDAILVEWDSVASTVAHEVGHYLGLEHTHRSADSPPPHRCFREPVSRTVEFSLFNLCLRPKGRRCQSTGDALCDTPADPNLSEHNMSGCTYTDNVTDYRGDAYSPDTRNVMSYSRSFCRDRFSVGQIGVMALDLMQDPRRDSEWRANERNAFDSFEPDNAADVARLFTLGDTELRSFHWDYLGFQTGQSVFQKCDEDWTSFELPTVTPVEIWTSEVPGQPRPNTILTLFDASLNVVAEDDDSSGNGFSRIEETLQPGRYLLRITNKSDYPHPDSRGQYRLTVRRCETCCFNPEIPPLVTLPFNLGARGATWVDFLPADLKVNGVSLSINAWRPLGFNGLFPENPSALEAHLCDGADLTIGKDGDLTVGDPVAPLRADLLVEAQSVVTIGDGGHAVVHRQSRLIIENGGRLVLEGAAEVRPGARILVRSGGILELSNGSDLAVQDTGRVVVGQGGRLVYRRGAGLRLHGDGAVLDLRGGLEVGASAVFTFTYPDTASGYVRFQPPKVPCTPDFLACPNVEIGSAAQMRFIGAARDDKVLEIAAPLRPGDEIHRFLVRQGTVELTGNGELQLGSGHLFLREVDFLSLAGFTGDFGLAVGGRPKVDIRDVLFDGTGLRAEAVGLGAQRLTLRDVVIRDADVGIWTWGKGVHLERVELSNNVFGWEASHLEGASVIRNSKIVGGGQGQYGVLIDEASGASARLVRSHVSEQQTVGIEAHGDVTVQVKCGSVRHNDVGFWLHDSARLDMSGLGDAGNVDASDNRRTIRLENAGGLDLLAGHNDLAARLGPIPKNPARVVEGTLLSPACNILTLDVDGNTWNHATFGPQLDPRNHQVKSALAACLGQPIELSDPQPAAPGACPPEPQDPCGLHPLICRKNPLFHCPECPRIRTASFDRLPLNQAVAEALSHLEPSDEGSFDRARAVRELAEIVSFLAQWRSPVRWRGSVFSLQELAVAKLELALAELAAEAPASGGEPFAQAVRQASVALEELHRRFRKARLFDRAARLRLVQARTQRLAGKPQRALTLLDRLEAGTLPPGLGLQVSRLRSALRIEIEARILSVSDQP